MKFLGNLLRFLAVLLLVLVVFALPLTLFGRSLGKVAFSPETIKAVLAKHFWNHDSAATAAEQLVDSAMLDSTAQWEPVEQFLLAGLSNLDHQQWLQLFALVAPQDVLAQTLDNLVNGFYAWLDNESVYPDLTVDTRAWKANASLNAVPVLELVLSTMPECTVDQLAQYAAGGDILNAAQIPLCRPPEPFYGLLLSSGSVVIPVQIQALPDNLNLTWRMNATPEAMLQLKTQLRRTRAILQWSWLPILLLFLIVIPLGARSIPGIFGWAGVPLLLSGGLTMLGSLLLYLSADTFVTTFSVGIPNQGLLGVFDPIRAAFTAGVGLLVRPLVSQGLIQLVLGGGALGAAFILGRMLKPKTPSAAYAQPWEAGPPTYYEDTDPYRQP
ncbi:MAG: hypothetical protein JXB38_13550 [Anaerolineales bacterium]|nr:hypothetical protein [Anaerolineales bacterium]